MALYEATAAFLTQLAATGARPLHEMSPAEARGLGTILREMYGPGPEVAQVRDERIPVGGGATIAARVLVPDGAPRGVIVYLHGGGWVIGAIDEFDALGRRMAQRTGAAVVLVDYRLAPEHRFPVAVDDSWAAMAWLAAHAGTLGLDGARLAVGGDSAGGTLAAVAAIHARDIGLPLALQLLITPGTTANADTPSHRLFGDGFLIDHTTIAWFFDHYIDRSQRHDWRFAPLEADDLDGVAPACVILAECDPLVDEGLAYADRLRAAGVAVELELYRGLTHDFIKMGRALKEAGHAVAAAGAALQRAWRRDR